MTAFAVVTPNQVTRKNAQESVTLEAGAIQLGLK